MLDILVVLLSVCVLAFAAHVATAGDLVLATAALLSFVTCPVLYFLSKRQTPHD